MPNGSTVFLVDTNVLVYAYDPADGVKQGRAMALLERLGARRIGSLSVQVLGEFFVTVTRKIAPPLSEAEAERSLTNYARSWRVFDITSLAVQEAARGVQRYRLSYWDALIWATAKLNAVPSVLSEDFNDGSLLEGVRFVNPFTPRFDPAFLEAAT